MSAPVPRIVDDWTHTLEALENGEQAPAEVAENVRHGGHSDIEPIPTLRELTERPELLEPPAVVVPRLAYRGRTTLIAAPDKSGKSTLMAHATAAKSRGWMFLGEGMARGRVVWIGLDEYIGDSVRRLVEMDADPDRVRILARQPPDILTALSAVLADWPADLVVVDSLAEYARVTLGRAPEDGDASGWGTVVRPVVALGHQHDCAIVLLHHPRRSDGQYRGSGEIAAAVDCLLEMTPPNDGEDPTLRRLRGRARWPVEPFSVRLSEGRYVLGGGGPLSLDAQVLADLAMHPGTTRSEQYRRLKGRKATYTNTVSKLIEHGDIADRSGKLFLPSDVEGDLL